MTAEPEIATVEVVAVVPLRVNVDAAGCDIASSARSKVILSVAPLTVALVGLGTPSALLVSDCAGQVATR